MVYDWGRPHRIEALALSSDGRLLVATDTECHLHVYNFITRELEYEMDLKVKLTSVSITKDSKYILVSKVDGEARLFSVEDRKSIRTFAGQKAGNFIIRSAFGGADESFVISGSEGTWEPRVDQLGVQSPNKNRWLYLHLAQRKWFYCGET